ncbi:MAG TPA: tryptophan 7-halogenase [Planctomycetaceae bacterium]|nr:tryptophan 7-halogenase [Planctomycetaceae bacterium]
MNKNTYDVVVLGSGFGGSLLAAILSRQGMRVALLDTARHPRFVIGESSTPAADLILHDLATRYDLPELLPFCRFGTWQATHPEIRCGCKRGFSYFFHGRGDAFEPSEAHTYELLVAASASREVADTQWYRPQVDQFLFQIANRRGCETWEGIDDLQIRHAGPSDWSIGFRHEEDTVAMKSLFLVDATGPRGVVLEALGIKSSAKSLRTHSSSLYGHWEGMVRLDAVLGDWGVNVGEYPFPSDEAALHHLFNDGWMWSLRFEDNLTSAGFLYKGLDSPATLADDPRVQWQQLISRSPLLQSVFESARLADWPGKMFRTGRLQRIAERGAGADWAALPATIGFIDPLHSTGIAHTLSGIESLSQILLQNQKRTIELDEYSNRILRELRWIDLLVAGCYRGLRQFELFVAWSMLYFAAATTFESRRFSRLSGNEPSGEMLCADDFEFQAKAERLWTRLCELTEDDRVPSPAQIDSFRDRVREEITAYNHVGLFAPAKPHLYFHTAAEKP